MRIVDVHEKVDLIRRALWEAHQGALSNLDEIEGLDEAHEKADAKLTGIKKVMNKLIKASSDGASFTYDFPPKISPSSGVTNLTINVGVKNAKNALGTLRDQIKKGGWGVVDTSSNKRHVLNNTGKGLFTKGLKDMDVIMGLLENYEEDLDD